MQSSFAFSLHPALPTPLQVHRSFISHISLRRPTTSFTSPCLRCAPTALQNSQAFESNVERSKIRAELLPEIYKPNDDDDAPDPLGDLIVDLDDTDEMDIDDIDNDLNVVDIGAPPQRTKRVRRRTSDLVNEIDIQTAPDDTYAGDADSQPPLEQDDILPYIRTVVQAADTRKAEDIIAIRVSKVTYITSFVIAATGNSPPQLRAIANLIEEDLTKQHGLEPRRVDGVPNSGWILLDCTSPFQTLTFLTIPFSFLICSIQSLEKLTFRPK